TVFESRLDGMAGAQIVDHQRRTRTHRVQLTNHNVLVFDLDRELLGYPEVRRHEVMIFGLDVHRIPFPLYKIPRPSPDYLAEEEMNIGAEGECIRRRTDQRLSGAPRRV